jgi:glucose-1-phosphate cytidylyltransferase
VAFYAKGIPMKTSAIPVFILAGGLGTRLSEETSLKPKPMVEIGDIPILVHVMRWYYSFGFNDFVICAGYKSWEIKDYFLNYKYRQNHLEIDHRTNANAEPKNLGTNLGQEKWRVSVIDTGLETMTGGRIARAFDIMSKTNTIENFAVTYGDGVANVDLVKELDFHLAHKKLGTMLGVPPISRFGEIEVGPNCEVKRFVEKPEGNKSPINGGFFFFNNKFRNYLSLDSETILEKAPLEKLAKDNELVVFEHKGFWQCMDTLRDKIYLQDIWDKGKAPWLAK